MRPDQLKPYLRRKMLTALSQSMTAVANEAVNWTGDRFRHQNWIDTTPEPWQPRNPNAKRNLGRKILIDTARLFRSTRIFSQSGTGFKYGSDVLYAGVHNWGLTITRHARSETFRRNRSRSGKFKKGTTPGRGLTFKAGSFQMPKRQSLGNSAHLRNILRRRAQVEIIRRMRA